MKKTLGILIGLSLISVALAADSGTSVDAGAAVETKADGAVTAEELGLSPDKEEKAPEPTPNVLVLSLKQKSYAWYESLDKAKTVAQVDVYACQQDPNRSGCTPRIEVDGKPIVASKKLLSRVNSLRRSFSYDALSGTIEKGGVDYGCKMGGDAMGLVLEARYLTYGDYKIVKSEMVPVMTEALNCLFHDETYSPKNAGAREDARVVMELLNVLSSGDLY